MATTTHLQALRVDLASQDVLIEVVRALEQQLWMIRAQLPATGGH